MNAPTTDQSAVTISKGSTTFTGDAIDLYRVVTLKSSIGLHRKCGMIPTRGVTISKMFAQATTFTGKTYKRGQHVAAENDLQIWIDAAKASMPIVDER